MHTQAQRDSQTDTHTLAHTHTTHGSGWKVATPDSVPWRIIQSLNLRLEIICASALFLVAKKHTQRTHIKPTQEYIYHAHIPSALPTPLSLYTKYKVMTNNSLNIIAFIKMTSR